MRYSGVLVQALKLTRQAPDQPMDEAASVEHCALFRGTKAVGYATYPPALSRSLEDPRVGDTTHRNSLVARQQAEKPHHPLRLWGSLEGFLFGLPAHKENDMETSY